MADSKQLADTRLAVASVTTSKQVNQDSWMAQWCTTNWGDLLQPAPLSISLLGSILIIASSTDDFSLDSNAPPPFTWKHALHLQKLPPADGWRWICHLKIQAFETAHKNMEIIRNNASQMLDVIGTIVNLVLKGSAQDISDLFQNSIDDLQALSKRCRDSAKEAETAFTEMADLAQEMGLACTYTSGTAEQLSQNELGTLKTHLQVLKIQRDNQEATVEKSKKDTEQMKNTLKRVEDGFYDAVRDVPKGWDLMGMHIVESLTGLAVSAGNAAISQATLGSQLMKTGMNAFASANSGAPAPPPVAPSTSPNGVSSQLNSATLYDPGTMLVQHVLDQVVGIKMLLTGHAGKPDWDKIRSKDGSTSGAAYVQGALNSLKTELQQLVPFIDQALSITTAILKTAGSVASANDNSLDTQVVPTDQLITGLQGLTHSVNLILRQPGMHVAGPATPPTQAAASGSAAASFCFKLILACARAEWLVSGVGVDLAVITSPRPAFRLASHFVGLARHFAQSGLRSPCLGHVFSQNCRDVPGNVYFPIASKWRAQAILPDAIKMGVGAACDENSRDSGHYTINGIGVVGELDLHPGIRTCPMPSQAILPDAIKELAFWLAPA
ncbi:hypothetical protein DFH07DRAFT_936282 [Mycena maculata]|uniref:Uncharacterized protein n=1 Tax=Mycena maculata TaxID=230809 RepID=A0AAD7K6Q3_9AGAR|nr:hypothetical protein DFH07DRAFT_936282 [Mycena maculata]